MLVLRPLQAHAIAAAAEAAWPNECCGLLVGRGQRLLRVTRVVPAPNVAAGANRFELDPRVRIATERDLRGGEDRVLGHYHSHPDGRAYPSATDLAEAWEPALVWLIVGTVGAAGVPAQAVQMLAHRLDRAAGRAHPVVLRIAEK
jgi:proteasome lid subunit RPN8/RPN11